MRALGIDVGTSTTKLVLIAVEGENVREVATHATPTPGDVPGLLAAISTGCRRLADHSGAIEAVGVASMAETGAPIDAYGEALTELLRWDAGHGAADAVAMAVLAPEVFARTGVRVSAKTPLTTWRWLQRERPDVWRRMRTWLSTADLAVHALTGERVTDHTLAGRTGGYPLAGPGERPAVAFDAELLDLAGLDPARLPRVAASDSVAGRVSSAAAAATGLTAGTAVVVAGHDHQVAAWAAGVRAPGDVADSLGTAEATLSVLSGRPEPEGVRRQGMSLVRTVGGQADAVVAGTSSAGAMLDHWLVGVPPESRADVLARAAREVVTGQQPTGAAVAPYLRGRQSPEPDPGAAAGAPPPGWPRERQARAVVEGICYQARWMIETQLAPASPQRVAVIGGRRLPALWRELKRVTLPWPVSSVSTGEPVAAGAALLALARTGALGDVATALSHAPTLATTSEPPPAWDAHGDAYDTFIRRVRG
ncbi:FGGY-family carbohydrate kinase [Pseudactinotalea sp.]|uniref:FGGY-family carbohydrate kinase n=1 Tax=Pseudactinotalea sp. TaxID=1926260 RepID=UPI003B3A6E46